MLHRHVSDDLKLYVGMSLETVIKYITTIKIFKSLKACDQYANCLSKHKQTDINHNQRPKMTAGTVASLQKSP